MMTDPFAVWITGLPGSGKSTLAAALKRELEDRGIRVEVLESDALRRVLTPRPRYDEEERDAFYSGMLYIGRLLLRHGVPVLFDGTAHLRRYRDRARELIPRFFEVYVDTPIEVCRERDPKGLYRERPGSLPGVGVPYEPPIRPEFIARDPRSAASIAQGILKRLSGAGTPRSAAPERGGEEDSGPS
jgi:adenylylsulfate kinase